jgi:uncharacterized protein
MSNYLERLKELEKVKKSAKPQMYLLTWTNDEGYVWRQEVEEKHLNAALKKWLDKYNIVIVKMIKD